MKALATPRAAPVPAETRAIPLSDASSEGGDGREAWPRGQETLPSALAALARLMQATSIDLIGRSPATGKVRTLLRTGTGDTAPPVRLPDENEDGFMAPRQFRWIAREDDTTAVLLVKLIERRDATVWAAIGFGVERARVPAPVIEAIPTFVTLLVSHAATMAALSDARAQVQSVVAGLDRQDGAIFIVKRDHGLLFANRAAHRIIGEKAGLQLSRGKLRPLAYQDGVRFETALDCIIDAPPRADAAPAPGMLLLLPVPGQERPMIVTIVPAGQAAGGPASARAAAIISAAMPDGTSDRGLEAICRMYALSPVETSLVRHLVAGASVTEAAAEMRVKVDTARSYLKNVFTKTGTNRQATLLQLITHYQRAVRGDYAFAST